MQTNHLFEKKWEEVRRITSICSHPELLEIFITANIIWIILGQIVRGAVVCDSTEQLRQIQSCRVWVLFQPQNCTAELSPLPVLAQAEITQLYFCPLSIAESRSLWL